MPTGPLSAAPSLDAHPSIRVGARFFFRGLHGQEPYETRMVGGGSVGWVIEICGISPTGSLGTRCAPSTDLIEAGQVVSVSYADALAMVGTGVWEPFDGV